MVNINFISGNKRVFINTILNNRLYVSKDWDIYRWTKYFKNKPPTTRTYNGFLITLVLANNKPIGEITSHFMLYTETETLTLNLNMYLRKEHRGKGIGSKMLEHHLNCLPDEYKQYPISFNCGLSSSILVIDHFEKKYDKIRFHIPSKGETSNEESQHQ